MKWLWFGLVVIMAACTSTGGDSTSQPLQSVDDGGGMTSQPAETAAPVDLPDMGQAPPLEGEVWLNAAQPLEWNELRGRVVLVEMWTFGCINCRRVIPHLRDWHDRYADQGLVIIGNHYPEFNFEKDLGNLKAAVQELEIEYPVVQDNQRLNWGSYNNRYWPTLYLVDKDGRLRYQHIGEGAYQLTERAIQALLAESTAG